MSLLLDTLSSSTQAGGLNGGLESGLSLSCSLGPWDLSNFTSLGLSAFYQVTTSSILKTLSSLGFYDSLLAVASKSSFFALNASALRHITIDTLMTLKFLSSV